MNDTSFRPPKRSRQMSIQLEFRSTSVTDRARPIMYSVHRPCPGPDLEDVDIRTQERVQVLLDETAFPRLVGLAACIGVECPIVAVAFPVFRIAPTSPGSTAQSPSAGYDLR